MSLTNTLRRTTVGLAAATLLVGGSVGFVAAATTAGASGDVSTAQVDSSIALHNNTAAAGTDCPAGGAAYWHFVFTPNNGSASFASITLDLGTETLTFSGAAIVPNGTQTDNVFVAVPAGHTLTDLVTSGSSATYTGATPGQFNLSHTCEGTVPTTPTTSSTTSSSTTSSSTSSSTTSSSTSSSTTSTTEAPTTSTTDTSVAPSSTVAPTTTAATVQVLGTVQTEAAAAVTTDGALPYTGTDTTGMAVAGLAVLLGGALLAGLARTKDRNLGEQ